MMNGSETESKKRLFDHIVSSMKENKLHLVKFDGIEIQKLIHEGELTLGESQDKHQTHDEDLYWSAEG